jgi:hypothetical protein
MFTFSDKGPRRSHPLAAPNIVKHDFYSDAHFYGGNGSRTPLKTKLKLLTTPFQSNNILRRLLLRLEPKKIKLLKCTSLRGAQSMIQSIQIYFIQ